MTGGSAQESSPSPLERLRLSGIKPERSLGQNFLIDPNILDVIERTAELSAGDVVLEVGPGLGVLTARLLERSALVHCVELDRRLAGVLSEQFGGRPNFRLHMGDAMRMPLGKLDPAPAKFVANLPYSVAAPLVMKSLDELPSIGLWCLMVQKEIADRLFAATGAANYGGVSVMTQLMSVKLSSRTISPSVFYPPPRVKSSLLAFKRRQPGEEAGEGRGRYTNENFAAVKEIVYAAFRHRRKKLVNSLAEADPAPAPLERLSTGERRLLIEDALERLGLSAGVRPQDLAPAEFEQLAALLIGGPGVIDE